MVALVALLVIGPERLPKIARITGLWMGKMRRMVTSIKAEIAEELRTEELLQTLKQQTELEEARRWVEKTSRAAEHLSAKGELLSNSLGSPPKKPSAASKQENHESKETGR